MQYKYAKATTGQYEWLKATTVQATTVVFRFQGLSIVRGLGMGRGGANGTCIHSPMSIWSPL